MNHKSYWLIALTCALFLIFPGCSNTSDMGDDKGDVAAVSSVSEVFDPSAAVETDVSTAPHKEKCYTYEIPENWTAAEAPDGYYYYPEYGMLYVSFSDTNVNNLPGWENALIQGFSASSKFFDIIDDWHETIAGYDVYRYTADTVLGDPDTNMYLDGAFFVTPTGLLSFQMGTEKDSSADYSTAFQHVLESVTPDHTWVDATVTAPKTCSICGETEGSPIEAAVDPTSSTPNTPEATEAPTESEGESLTTGQKNALREAKNYLDYSAFSHDGLIGQLEYEGYTTDEATYAADNCGADWNEQALREAKSYLDYSAFSYSGLIEQLEYEEYTTEQATYAADNCGADWNEQAAREAESYLSYSAFSRDELIDQLEYEGYTSEQAIYGVEANGY